MSFDSCLGFCTTTTMMMWYILRVYNLNLPDESKDIFGDAHRFEKYVETWRV